MIKNIILEQFETNSFHINLSNFCEKKCNHCFNWELSDKKENNLLKSLEKYFSYSFHHIENMNKELNIKLNEFQFMGEDFFYNLNKNEYEYFFLIFDEYNEKFKKFNQNFQYSFHTCLTKPLNEYLLQEMIKRKDLLMLDVYYYPFDDVVNNIEVENNIKKINKLIHVEVTTFLTQKVSDEILNNNFLRKLDDLNGKNIAIPPYEDMLIDKYPKYNDIFLVDKELKKNKMLFEIVVGDYIFANTELTFYMYNDKVTYHQTINYNNITLDINDYDEKKLVLFLKKSINKNLEIKINNIIKQNCINCKYLKKCLGGYIFKNKSYYYEKENIKECNGFINLRN